MERTNSLLEHPQVEHFYSQAAPPRALCLRARSPFLGSRFDPPFQREETPLRANRPRSFGLDESLKIGPDAGSTADALSITAENDADARVREYASKALAKVRGE